MDLVDFLALLCDPKSYNGIERETPSLALGMYEFNQLKLKSCFLRGPQTFIQRWRRQWRPAWRCVSSTKAIL